MTYSNTEKTKANPPVAQEEDWPITGQLWANELQDGRLSLKATFASVYKDKKTGEYKKSQSFDGANLLKLAHVARKLYDARLDIERKHHKAQSQNQTTDTNAPHQDGV